MEVPSLQQSGKGVSFGSGPYGQSGYAPARYFDKDLPFIFQQVGIEDDELAWGERKQLIAQLYQIMRTQPLVLAAGQRLGRFVIGNSPWPRFSTSDSDFNEAARDVLVDHLSNPLKFDLRQRLNFAEMLQTAFVHAYLMAGDCGLRFHENMSFEPYESDCIGPPSEGSAPKNEVLGLQIDNSGRYIGFRVGSRTRGQQALENSEVLEPREFIFAAKRMPHRFDQIRGTPVLAVAFSRFLRVNEISESELKALANASKMVMTVPVEDLPINDLPRDSDGNPIFPKITLEDNTVAYVPSEMEPKMFNITRPNPQLKEFLDSILFEAASAIDISYKRLTGQSIKNFSQNRGDDKDDAESFANMQHWVRRNFQLDRIIYRLVKYYVKRGDLPKPPKEWKFESLHRTLRFSWPKIEYVDPYKGEQTKRIARENGKSLHEIMGDDWRDQLKQSFVEEKYLAELEKETGISRDRIIKPITSASERLEREPEREGETDDDSEESKVDAEGSDI